MWKIIPYIVFSLLSLPAFARESIKDLHSEIAVQKDASVIITERITVDREGDRIKRGIYRDLPKTKGVSYSVLSVSRDGASEPFFTENAGNYYRINTGNDNYLPRNGLYTFEIKYRATNVILGFDDHDEIYWNVTGNEWIFPIERASAKVVLPEGVKVKRFASYIGRRGSRASGEYDPETRLFSSPRPLDRGEGLTVAVGFDKGFVSLPRTDRDVLAGTGFDGRPLTEYARYAFLIFCVYLFVTWHLFGRDPEKDAIMPRFKGLTDLTPALAGWIYSYGHNKEGCLAAALLQGGLSGFLKIKYNDGLLKVTKERSSQTGEEKTLERYITEPLVVVDKYSSKMERFMLGLSDFLEQKAQEKYFTSNTTLVVLGGILAMALTTGLCFLAEVPFLSVILGVYLIAFIPLGKRCLKGIVLKKLPYISFGTLFLLALHFFASTYEAILNSADVETIILFYFLSIIALIVYSYLIIRPTREGMKIISYLDGIKMFLETVDPTRSKEIDFNKMEALLPYAFLLGMERKWEAKMKIITGALYQPDWFNGRFSVKQFGKVNVTLCKACTRPARSGLGRFGHSGGGFGGGGGGGR